MHHLGRSVTLEQEHVGLVLRDLFTQFTDLDVVQVLVVQADAQLVAHHAQGFLRVQQPQVRIVTVLRLGVQRQPSHTAQFLEHGIVHGAVAVRHGRCLDALIDHTLAQNVQPIERSVVLDRHGAHMRGSLQRIDRFIGARMLQAQLHRCHRLAGEQADRVCTFALHFVDHIGEETDPFRLKLDIGVHRTALQARIDLFTDQQYHAQHRDAQCDHELCTYG